MGFFDIFRRPPPINDVATLGTFIDEQSAFIAQKGVYEFSRARAGHYAKVLFQEKEFLDAADQARWKAYPLGLAMVGEMVEGVLRRHAAAENQAAARDALIRLTVIASGCVPRSKRCAISTPSPATCCFARDDFVCAQIMPSSTNGEPRGYWIARFRGR